MESSTSSPAPPDFGAILQTLSTAVAGINASMAGINKLLESEGILPLLPTLPPAAPSTSTWNAHLDDTIYVQDLASTANSVATDVAMDLNTSAHPSTSAFCLQEHVTEALIPGRQASRPQEQLQSPFAATKHATFNNTPHSPHASPSETSLPPKSPTPYVSPVAALRPLPAPLSRASASSSLLNALAEIRPPEEFRHSDDQDEIFDPGDDADALGRYEYLPPMQNRAFILPGRRPLRSSTYSPSHVDMCMSRFSEPQFLAVAHEAKNAVDALRALDSSASNSRVTTGTP